MFLFASGGVPPVKSAEYGLLFFIRNAQSVVSDGQGDMPSGLMSRQFYHGLFPGWLYAVGYGIFKQNGQELVQLRRV